MKININNKITIFVIIIILLTISGVSYAFFSYSQLGDQGNEIVTGQIYMDYEETNEILLNSVFPMSKDEAIDPDNTDNVFNFTIKAQNTSSKDIYYGISLVDGNVRDGMTRFNKEHIMIYLTCDGNVLIDGVRYSEWNNGKIWIDTILANTNSQITKNYSLRVWIDERVTIADGKPADYTSEVWNNSYASIKVNVDGNLDNMSMPLSILTSNSYVENGKSYFMVSFSNFTDLLDLGKAVNPSDNMNLQITSASSDTVFSYSDDLGNTVVTTSDSLDLDYVFNTNKTVEVKVFIIPKNDSNSNNDIRIRLEKNGVLVQSLIKRIFVKGNNYCLNNDFNKLKDCLIVSSGNEITTVQAGMDYIEGRTFTVGNIAPMYVNNEIDTANSDLGLYATSDDYGTSYFYRGAVTNNNVKFAGHYWKIVRINGDGSIRLIYNGETSGATGNDTSIRTGASTRTYQFNSMHPDPTYVGYMYGDDLVSQWSEETNYTNLTDTRYVFTKNVPVSNDETRIYTLNGTTKDTDYVIKTPTEMNGDVTIDGVTKKYYEEYTYTCKQTRDASYTDATSTTCQFVIKMTGYNNTTSIKAQYLSYSSTSKDNTRKNNVSSNIKTVLENWYTENILNETDNRGNSYDKYVVDGTFCNDRGTTDSGYLRHEASNYAGYNRLTRATPTPQLTCGSDIRDKFSVTSYRGNAQLTRPIGLLTADELVFAGIKWYNAQTNPSNVSNYLTTNGYWWTMTPAYTFQKNASGFVIIILPAGYLSIYYGVTIGIGARAVINLSPETIIYKGNGTTGSPYEVIME